MSSLRNKIPLSRYGQQKLSNAFQYTKKEEKKIGIEPQKGGQRLFYNCSADIVIYGGAAGSGKSVALLLDAAKPEFLKNPGYTATIFRRSYPEITNPGGLLDESRLLYEKIGGVLRINPVDWRFPTGSKISFRHIQHEKSIYNYQGSQICKIGFDELTHFSASMFFYMLSRNRSGCGIKPTVRATTNPDADSWVAKFIEWWIDEDSGLPIPSRRGVVRYFIRIDEELFWADSAEKLKSEFGDDVLPMSVTFIYASVYDNQKLIDKNPGYIANLKALHPVEQERLLHGNWKIRLESGAIFNRDWFPVVDDIKRNESKGILVRFWDLAATSKETADSKTYYTASVKMLKIGCKYYVVNVTYDRISGGRIEDHIRRVAKQDGDECRVRWELEGGAAGKIIAQTFRDNLLADNSNYDVMAIKPQGDKVTRAMNVATIANQGNVFILRADWNTKFLNALQDFDGSKKPLTNDICDALSGAFNELEKAVDYDFNDADNLSLITPKHDFNRFFRF